jgi:hypothetical protein
VFLISTIRSDFLDRFEYLPELLKLYNTLKGDYLLPTMTEAGLRELIVYPARLESALAEPSAGGQCQLGRCRPWWEG